MSDRPQNQETVAQGGVAILDVWFYQYTGGNLVDPDPVPTYKIYDPTSTLKQSGSGTRISLGKYSATYNVPQDAQISNLWRIEWTATINGTVITNYEYFIVVEAGSIVFDDVVKISGDWLDQIKKKHAYPVIDKVLLSDDEIKTYCVKQALNEYFIKFPISVYTDAMINGEVALDFPDEQTFGVFNVSITGKGYKGASVGSFWDLVVWQKFGYNTNRSMYGSKVYNYNPNMLLQQRHMDRQVINTLINQGTFKYRVDQHLRKVYIYSTMSAYYTIAWAKYSNDFNDVKFQFRWDVIQIAQSYLLQHIADLADIADDSVAEIKIDSATLREKATDLRQKITDKWLEYPDIAVLKTS